MIKNGGCVKIPFTLMHMVTRVRQSYELGFTPYRLYTNSDGAFVTPIRVYDGHVYVLDDVTTMQVTTRQIATDTISNI